VEINDALSGVSRLGNVVLEQREQVLQALELHASGMDFADALHLSGSYQAETFYSFDEAFVTLGKSLGRQISFPE
jgi:hypothetical protein